MTAIERSAEVRNRRALIPMLGAGATFLAMLDTTVVNLAVPDLRHDFTNSSIPDLTWIITLYAVVFAALLAPAGRLADVLGRRALFRAGIGIFTVMSLLCALAPNLSTLLVARALQGAGAAAMIPASLAILLHDTEPERRAGAIGQWSAAGALAAAIGPSLGGMLVDTLGWRSLFYINVPIGLALVYSARRVPAGTSARGRLPDLIGSALLGAGLGGLALGITQAPSWHWSSLRTLGALVGGVTAVSLALWRSRRHPVPAVEISLWRNRTFAVVNLVSALYGAALYPWLLASVLFLTQVWHYTELEAGLAVSPGALTATLAAMTLGKLSRMVSPRAAVIGGALILAAAALWPVAALPAQSRFLSYWLPLGLLVGIGMGALAVGCASAAALSAGPQRFAQGTGLNTTARQFGGVIGVAILAALLLDHAPARVADFKNVYLISVIASLAAAITGLWISLRPAVPATSGPAPHSVDVHDGESSLADVR